MNDFAARIGVGQRQPNDSHVTDLARTRELIIPGEHKPIAAQLIEHRSGRIDATVLMDTTHTSRDEIRDVQQTLGMTDDEIRRALNNIFGVKGRLNVKRR